MEADLKKYYHPDISEFHVGFEFEVDYGDRWIKEAIYNAPQVVTLPYMKLENIRVKYLDREDIESLGFNITKDNEEIELSLESKKYIGGPSAGDDYKIIILYGLDNKEMWIYKKHNNGYECDLFKGLIKNKSELKKLLKQLKIID